MLMEVVMKWLEIGRYVAEGSDLIKIDLYEGYETALTQLHLFSHCHLYFLQKNRLDMKVTRIEEIDINKGRLILNFLHSDMSEVISGQLVDIKPYFPNEEVILEAEEQKTSVNISYQSDFAGTYRVSGDKTILELKGNEDHSIKVGDFLRIYWYFHRFDKDQFRKNRMCRPPYNNAPKTGIFASRSPVRPNPLGVTNVKVIGVDSVRGVVEILGFDGFDGSKILQVDSYLPSTERVEGVQLPEWVAHWTPYKKFAPPKKLSFNEKVLVDKVIFDGEPSNLSQDLEFLNDTVEELNSSDIHVHNACINNLKGVDITIPKEKITLITGVSGSGKSSLAFDTVYNQSQKQFMDLVMSNQMLSDTFSEVYVDKITGLKPSIAISQGSLGANPRSTVGSVTRIAEVIKLLYSLLGDRLCPSCFSLVDSSNVCTNCGEILFDSTPQMFSYNHPDYMCPVCKGLGEELQIDKGLIVEYPERSLLDSASSLYGNLRKHRKKPNANWMRGEILALALDLDIDLDQPFKDLPESFKKEFYYGSNGREVSLTYENSKGRSGVITRPVEGAVNLIERLIRDTKSDKGLTNSKKFMSRTICHRCNGERLLEVGRLVNIMGYRYPEIMKFSIKSLIDWCHNIYNHMSREDQVKSRNLLTKTLLRLKRVVDVGLGYITLDRSIPTLSGGEVQRLKLATQFGTGLSDLLYIMDEPSKGLHPKDYSFLMNAITDLKAYSNTIILVEHKKSFLSIADKHIIMGPKAGRYGGEVVLEEYCSDLKDDSDDELEGFNGLNIVDNEIRKSTIDIWGASTNNLKDIDLSIPIGQITTLIGVSGSGKSSLISKTLYPEVLEYLGKRVDQRGVFKRITGLESFSDTDYVSQKPIGSNSRSNPGTYTGVFDLIRKCYSTLPEAKSKKMGQEFFSFNSKKGQCPECSGFGEVAVNMHYMDDIMVNCNKCHGKRYNPEVLKIKREGYSIGDVLEMEINQLLEVFNNEKRIYDMLHMLDRIGLGYLKLGQSASSLSGGEAQRIKLAKELYREDSSNVLYILDEPTTGLHEDDIDKLLSVIQELKGRGATLIIIEHNLQLIRESDYIVELGPEGGESGGYIIRKGFLQLEE